MSEDRDPDLQKLFAEAHEDLPGETFAAAVMSSIQNDGRQVMRHKLIDMSLRIDAARSLVHELAYRIEHRLGDPALLVARIAMAKVLATQAMQYCADQALQILGGMGYMRGTCSERIYREAKVMMIGGGSEEILKGLLGVTEPEILLLFDTQVKIGAKTVPFRANPLS